MKEFKLKSCTLTDLALLYRPHSTPRSASKTLKNWINLNPELFTALVATGYNPQVLYWLMPGHSGRACNHKDIYTKMNKNTGKCYSVKFCNPSLLTTTAQSAQRTHFGKLSAALSG